MNTKLIMLPTPIIASDDTENTGGKMLIYVGETIEHQPKQDTPQIKRFSIHPNTIYIGKPDNNYKLIIAGYNDLPSIDWNGLEDEFEYFDIDKLADNQLGGLAPGVGVHEGFIRGFNKSQELTGNNFNLDDIKGYLSFIEDNYHFHSSIWHDADTDEPVQRTEMLSAYIQSIRPKTFNIEVEMETVWLNKRGWQPFPDHAATERKRIPKITVNNKIKIIKKL